MSRTGMIIVLGILTILMPFSGFPMAARSFFTVIFGIIVLGIGLSLRAGEAQSMKTGVE